MADTDAMHNLSWATGVAVQRLMQDAGYQADEREIAEYVQFARERLALDNASIVCAMMITQPLIRLFSPEWKFAYTVAVSLGTKLVTEGFFVADIIEHLTNEFSLTALKSGERMAMSHYDWLDFPSRQQTFRNALISVALESPRAGPMRITQGGEEAMHVLIVDSSNDVGKRHESLVLQCEPGAHVYRCCSAWAAIDHITRCREQLVQVNLILLDVFFSIAAQPGSARGDADGLSFTASLDNLMCTSTTGVGWRPLVAFVTQHHEWLTERTPMLDDGSIGGADVLLHKPLNPNSLRVLMEASSI